MTQWKKHLNLLRSTTKIRFQIISSMRVANPSRRNSDLPQDTVRPVTRQRPACVQTLTPTSENTISATHLYPKYL